MLIFEWDEEKDRRNQAKHKIAFEDAKLVFADKFARETFDDRFDYGEERVLSVGMTAKGLLAVASVQRDGRTRIISARAATRQEVDDYFQNRS